MAGGLERRLGQLEAAAAAAAAARMEAQEDLLSNENLRKIAFLLETALRPKEWGRSYGGEVYEHATQFRAMFEEMTGMSAEEWLELGGGGA